MSSSSIRIIQQTVFGKGAKSAEAAAHAIIERSTANKQIPKPSVTQLANFNNKQQFKKLAANPPTVAKTGSLGASRAHQEPQQGLKHSKWYNHIKRLEKKTLKENIGIEERLMRSKQSLQNVDEFEDARDKKKRAPDSRLISELKGVPEKGKLAKPLPVDDKRTTQRVQKMGERIRAELIREIASNNVPNFDYDARVGRPEILDVVMSSDLRRAKVVWMPPVLAGSDPRVTKDWNQRFEVAKGYLRNMLGSRIRTRFVPDLEFKVDAFDRRSEQLENTDAGENGFTEGSVIRNKKQNGKSTGGKRSLLLADNTEPTLEDADYETLELEETKQDSRKASSMDIGRGKDLTIADSQKPIEHSSTDSSFTSVDDAAGADNEVRKSGRARPQRQRRGH